MAIENTSRRNPNIHVDGILAAGQGRYIENMEAVGQSQVVHGDRLPAELLSPRREFEDLGFVFGDPDPDDPLFMAAALPEGWTREGSDHAMWSYLLDRRGVRRVAVFYKAAFYDRHADMRVHNVGYHLANDAIYSEGDAFDLPPHEYTPAELTAAVKACDDYLDSAKGCPQVYGDRVPKVTVLRRRLGELLVEAQAQAGA